MELEVTTFHLPDAIENALLLVRERASRHGIKLDRTIDERLGDFTGDERKVKQILGQSSDQRREVHAGGRADQGRGKIG